MEAPHFGNVSQLVKWIINRVPIIYALTSVIKDSSREVNRTATDITLSSSIDYSTGTRLIMLH